MKKLFISSMLALAVCLNAMAAEWSINFAEIGERNSLADKYGASMSEAVDAGMGTVTLGEELNPNFGIQTGTTWLYRTAQKALYQGNGGGRNFGVFNAIAKQIITLDIDVEPSATNATLKRTNGNIRIYEVTADGTVVFNLARYNHIYSISVADPDLNVSPLDEAKENALSKVDALPVGTGLFSYNSADIEAYKNAVNAATTVEAINAIAMPEMTKPEAGKQYQISNKTAEGTYLGQAMLSAEAEPILFEEATSGYYIKVRDNYLNMKGGNTWSMAATETATTVWTITPTTDGAYTIKGPNGLVGSDSKDAGSATYGNKSADKNGLWLIEPFGASTEPEAPKEYNYSIIDSFGTLLSQGSAFDGDNVSCAVNKYINKDGVLYETAKSSDWYHPSFTVSPENLQFTVTYNATDINNVVFYSEGEDLPGATGGDKNISRTSKGLTGYGQDLPVTTLAAGNYIFNIHAANGNSAARAVQIKADGNIVAELSIAGGNNNQDLSTENITLTATSNITISSEGSSASGIDYLYIVKTGDYVAPKDYTITYVVDGVNTTATFTEGTAVTPIADPVKEGYEFKGWVPAIPETLTEDITVTAQFEKIIVNYDVTLFAGEGGSVFGEGQFAENSTVTIDAIAEDDYDFVGWFSGALLVSKDAYYSFELTGNTNLTAKFEKKAPATEPMDITVSQIGYNTLTAAKNIDIAGSGLKAYIASSASGNTIKLTSVEKLVADNAYFIVGTASKTYTVTATAEEFDAPANNYFVPVSETTTIGEKNGAYTNCYLGVDKNGENPGFYMVDGLITISAGKAYLSAPIENATASIIFEFEDEDATIVINAAADAKIANGAYSIDGMAVKSAKGIIVKDGKKFIVK